MSSLGKVYLDHRPDARGVAELDALLEDAARIAREALPDVGVDAEELALALAGLPRAITEVDGEAVCELALALGCARGERAAIARLEAEYFPAIERALAGMKLDRGTHEEVLQEVRRKLLVGDGGPPRLVGYAGRGSLRGLLKVTATRTAISMLRKAGREGPADEALIDASGERDPELAFLKERYRAAFREAFEDAVSALEPRERNLLRLHFLRKVTLDALASMYGVHRATIVRQLAKIRDDLDRRTQRGLGERLGAKRDELESVMDLVRSRFDVSVERLLGTIEE